MATLIKKEEETVSRVRGKRLLKWVKRIFFVELLLGAIVLGCLFTVGLPFAWLIRMASDQEVVPGLAWDCQKGRLRAQLDGTVLLEVGRVTLGNRGVAELGQLESMSIEWRVAGLADGSVSPRSIAIKGLKLTPRINEEGSLVFLESSLSDPDQEERSERLDLEAIPRFLFPAEDHPLMIVAEDLELRLPDGFESPVRSAVTHLEIEVSRNHDRLMIKSGLKELLNEDTIAILEGNTDLSLELKSGLVALSNRYDIRMRAAEGLLGSYGIDQLEGVIELQSEINGTLLQMGAWRMNGEGLLHGFKVKTGDLFLDLTTAPVRVEGEWVTEGMERPTSIRWKVQNQVGADVLTNEWNGSFNLDTLEGRLEGVLNVTAVEKLLPLIPVGLPKVEGGIELSGEGTFDLAFPKLEMMQVEVETTPLTVAVSEELELALPPVKTGIEASGGLGERGQPYGTLNVVSKLLFSEGNIAETRLNGRLEAVSPHVSVQVESDGWDLAAMQEMIDQTLDVEAEGSFGFKAGLGYSLEAAELTEAQLSIDLNAIQLLAGAYLKKALVIPTTSFHAQVEGHFEEGEIRPFVFTTGPFSLQSDGFLWARRAGSIEGKGNVELKAISGRFLREWIVDDLLESLPLLDEELAEIGIVDTRMEVHIEGTDERLPVIDFRVQTGAQLNEGTVESTIQGHFDPNTEDWDIALEIPDFIQAQWNLAILKRFPSPSLNAPVTASFAASGRLPDQIEEARWALEVKEGEVDFGDLLKDWLVKPFPVTHFRVAGALEEGAKRLKLDSLELRSKRGILAFNRGELEKADTFIVQNETPAEVDLQFELRDWYLGDFAALLSDDALALLQLKGRDLDRVGLEHFLVDTQLAFAQEAAGVRLMSLAGKTNAVFWVGGASVPLDIELRFDEGRSVVSALTRVNTFEPKLVDLDYLNELLPLEIGSVDIPITCEVKLEAGIPVPGNESVEPPLAELKVIAGPGQIQANRFFRITTPLKEASMTGRIRVDELKLEAFRVFADFEGPQLLLDQVELKAGLEGAPVEGRIHLRANDWDMGWLHARIPGVMGETIIPKEVLDAQVDGMVDTFDLHAAFVLDLAAPSPSSLKTLSIEMKSRDFEVALPGYPEAVMRSLSLKGDTEKLVLTVADAGVDGVKARLMEMEVRNPLAPLPEGSVTLNMEGDLGQLNGLLGSWTLRPEAIDPAWVNGLDGFFHFNLRASAPLSTSFEAENIHSDFNFDLWAEPIPLLIEGVRLGKVNTQFEGTVEGGRILVTGHGDVREAAIDSIIAGDLAFQWKATSDFEALFFDGSVDLREMELSLSDLGWIKPRGQMASCSLGLELPNLPEEGERLQFGYLLGARGLVFDQVNGNGSIEIDLQSSDPYGGLRTLELRQLTLDATDLNARVVVEEGGGLDVQLGSHHLDIAEIVRRVEPMVAHLQKEMMEERALAEASADALSNAEGNDVALGNDNETKRASPLFGLPPINLTADFSEIYMGGAEYLRIAKIHGAIAEGLPRYLEAGFHYGSDFLELHLDSKKGDAAFHDWSFELTGIGSLVNTLLQPLFELEEVTCPQGSELEMLRDLPLSVAGGHLRLAGKANLNPEALEVEGGMELSGLVFEKEISFLSKIAHLVDRQVYLQVPFKRFDIDRFHYDARSAEVLELYIDGPVDISFESIEANLMGSELLAKGKVFGVCFEVAGLFDDLSFYLCDDMPGVGAFTSEDEFVW